MTCTFTNVRKSYAEKVVLKDVNLALESGTRYALCGESGSGKTTLLRLFCALEKPDSGTITYPSDTRFSYAFQEPRLFMQLRIIDNIRLLSPTRDPMAILAALDIASAAEQYPGELSGGMRTRAALARAFAVAADVYLLDEPTAGQDAAHAAQVLEAIRTYTAGSLVIAASHDADFIRLFAERKILLADEAASLL